MRRVALPLTLLALLGLEMFTGLPSVFLGFVLQGLATAPPWFYGFLALLCLAPVVAAVGAALRRRRALASTRSGERG